MYNAAIHLVTTPVLIIITTLSYLFRYLVHSEIAAYYALAMTWRELILKVKANLAHFSSHTHFLLKRSLARSVFYSIHTRHPSVHCSLIANRVPLKPNTTIHTIKTN